MFLLNEVKKEIFEEIFGYLQYKMFLLNKTFEKMLKEEFEIYNTKCFY